MSPRDEMARIDLGDDDSDDALADALKQLQRQQGQEGEPREGEPREDEQGSRRRFEEQQEAEREKSREQIEGAVEAIRERVLGVVVSQIDACHLIPRAHPSGPFTCVPSSSLHGVLPCLTRSIPAVRLEMPIGSSRRPRSSGG